ncbi:MAG: hypothetical protein R3212_08250, partial [Xanthomonadales bacterium]|nr:hypothetical protein [Xanthomonadales bacterium]
AAQDWQVVAGALQADRNRRRAWLGGLAAAASVALVITLLALPRTDEAISTGHELAGEQPAAVAQPDVAAAQPGSEELMAMSLEMERQLRFLRSQVGSMPSEMVVYQVELQDLIGQVDDALSLNPDSDALWGQRLGLQMNLVKLYRGQLRRDYAHMASL